MFFSKNKKEIDIFTQESHIIKIFCVSLYYINNLN